MGAEHMQAEEPKVAAGQTGTGTGTGDYWN